MEARNSSHTKKLFGITVRIFRYSDPYGRGIYLEPVWQSDYVLDSYSCNHYSNCHSNHKYKGGFVQLLMFLCSIWEGPFDGFVATAVIICTRVLEQQVNWSHLILKCHLASKYCKRVLPNGLTSALLDWIEANRSVITTDPVMLCGGRVVGEQSLDADLLAGLCNVSIDLVRFLRVVSLYLVTLQAVFSHRIILYYPPIGPKTLLAVRRGDRWSPPSRPPLLLNQHSGQKT